MRAIESIQTVEADGGFLLGGEATAYIVTPSATGSGGFEIGGEATVRASHWSYTPDAETATLIIAGESGITSSAWSYEGSGGFVMAGEADEVSPYYSLEGSG